MDDKNETIRELNKEEKGKLTKLITFDEWGTLVGLIKDLSHMVLELSRKVDELESRTIGITPGVTNPVKLQGVKISEIVPKGENNEE